MEKNKGKIKEVIIVSICEDSGGKIVAAGKTIQGERPWDDIFTDCAHIMIKNKTVGELTVEENYTVV